MNTENPTIPKPPKPKSSKIVGNFIKQRRSALKISQRSLGQMFNPPVTTQFISNVERGVTPLPPIHVPTLSKALQVSETELMKLLEQEYASKLGLRLGAPEDVQSTRVLSMPAEYHGFFQKIYDAYRAADEKTRQAFATVCDSILNIPKEQPTRE